MKKRYRDEKGRFCKQWQTPEAKARRQTPEYKAKEKIRHQTPKYKAQAKAIQQKPKVKARVKARLQTPEGRKQVRALSARKRAKRLQREISLDEAGRKAIAEIYANCPDDWHVDHIAPLLGKTISGLHLPENLQYLPEWVNHMKGNRWEESWAEHTIDTPLEEKIKAYQLNYEGGKWHE